MVLAAGMGSRYGGLKQIDPVGLSGEAIMDYSVYDALRAGFGRLVFVIRRDIEQAFKSTVGSRFEERIQTDYVYQELTALPEGFQVPAGREKPWGTGHAILMGAKAIQEPFAVINADDFYGRESFRLLGEHLSKGTSECAMVGFILENTLSEFGAVARGVCQCGDNGYLGSIREITGIQRKQSGIEYVDETGHPQQLTGREVVSLNTWGFSPNIFPQLEAQFVEFLRARGSELKAEFYIPWALNNLISANALRLKVLRTPASWFGVTYREDRPRVIESIKQLVEAGEYPVKLWS
jgi:UTP-glucose-1-phosphate uridylyltransferase